MKCPTNKRQFHCRNDAIEANCLIGRQTKIYRSIYRCIWCNDFHFASRNYKNKIKKLKDTNL